MPNGTQGEVQPRIRRGRVDALFLYEVTDYELLVLEEGSPGATYLNFAIFFLSVALSFLAALLVATALPQLAFVIFVVIVVVGFSLGGVLLVLWYRTRTRISRVIQKIKERCLPETPPAPRNPPPPTAAAEGAQSSG